MSVAPARLAALWELDGRELPGWPRHAFKRLRRPTLVDPRDVDLAEHIVRGVVKQLLVLQRLVAEYAGRPLAKIDVPLQKILAVAFHQMRTLDRVPAHAIVDDAVEMTKLVGQRGASGFVNAVCRKAAGERAAGRAMVGADAAARAEAEESFPRLVFDRFAGLYGTEHALEICRGLNADPPILARLIGDATISAIRDRGVSVDPHERAGVVVVREARRSQLRELSDAGLLQPQDATSVAVADHLDLRPGQRVLDRCAGRGTKTQQILERVGPLGEVVAMDPNEERMRSLDAMLAARAVVNVRTVRGGSIAELGAAGGRPFDRVLIDAPCSNSGVLARRPEARYQQDARHVADVVALQRQILTDTSDVVAHGGRLVYATCSIWPEENERLIDAFLAADPRFTRLEQATTLPEPAADPTRYHDGGYVAVLERRIDL